MILLLTAILQGAGHAAIDQYLVAAGPTAANLQQGVRWPTAVTDRDMRKLLVPRTHDKLGDRSFSAAGPRLWNDLPPGLRRPGLTFDSFRQSLKSHLFGD